MRKRRDTPADAMAKLAVETRSFKAQAIFLFYFPSIHFLFFCGLRKKKVDWREIELKKKESGLKGSRIKKNIRFGW